MKRGDPVTINFTSADAHVAAPVILKDSTGKTRTLQSYEALIVTALQANVSVTAAGADVFASADDTNNGDVIIGSFATVAGGGVAFTTILPHDGIGCPQGVTPKVVAANAGAITVVGSGYIVTDSTQLGRQSWQAKLNP